MLHTNVIKRPATTLPPLIVGTRKPWASPGIGKKPNDCNVCPFSYTSVGFVPDWVGNDVRAAVILPVPTKDDINARVPFSGDMGSYVLRTYFSPIGLSKENLIISYLLRCKPPWNAAKRKEAYPTGRTRELAEERCRRYDNQHGLRGELTPGGLKDFNPNIFLITFEPKEVFQVPSYYRQLQRDMQKLRYFINEGYRPLLLMGNEPAEYYAPYIVGHGSSKFWRGHFEEI